MPPLRVDEKLMCRREKRNHKTQEIDMKKVRNMFSQQNLSESSLYEQSLLCEHDTEKASDTVYKAKPRGSQLRNLLDLYSCSILSEIIEGNVKVKKYQGVSIFASQINFKHRLGIIEVELEEMSKVDIMTFLFRLL